MITIIETIKYIYTMELSCVLPKVVWISIKWHSRKMETQILLYVHVVRGCKIFFISKMVEWNICRQLSTSEILKVSMFRPNINNVTYKLDKQFLSYFDTFFFTRNHSHSFFLFIFNIYI